MLEAALGDEALLQIFYNLPSKRKRGSKECPICGLYVAASLKKCKCGHQFFLLQTPKLPKKYKKWQVTDWKNLNAGDIIYLINQDYWVNSEEDLFLIGKNGEFLVKRITDEGLLLFGNSGFIFQTMTNLGYQEKTGITRGQSKIYRKP